MEPLPIRTSSRWLMRIGCAYLSTFYIRRCGKQPGWLGEILLARFHRIAIQLISQFWL